MKIPSEPIRKERICQNLTEAFGEELGFSIYYCKADPPLKKKNRVGRPFTIVDVTLSGSQWPKSQVPFCSHASYPLTAAMKDWFRLCDTRGVQFILLWCGLSVGRQMLPFLSCSERSLRPAMGHAGALQINFTNCISTGFGEICWLRRVPLCLFHLVSAMFANTRRIENPPNICNRLHIVFIAETNGKWNCKIKQAQKDTFFKAGPRFEETNKWTTMNQD